MKLEDIIEALVIDLRSSCHGFILSRKPLTEGIFGGAAVVLLQVRCSVRWSEL